VVGKLPMRQIIWNDEADGNVDHVLEHGLTPNDVEFVLSNFESEGKSHSTGRPCVFGYTEDGRYVIVIYEEIDKDTIYPITAYDVPEP
jgi:uncharacterized DUF497 family protein